MKNHLLALTFFQLKKKEKTSSSAQRMLQENHVHKYAEERDRACDSQQFVLLVALCSAFQHRAHFSSAMLCACNTAGVICTLFFIEKGIVLQGPVPFSQHSGDVCEICVLWDVLSYRFSSCSP